MPTQSDLLHHVWCSGPGPRHGHVTANGLDPISHDYSGPSLISLVPHPYLSVLSLPSYPNGPITPPSPSLYFLSATPSLAPTDGGWHPARATLPSVYSLLHVRLKASRAARECQQPPLCAPGRRHLLLMHLAVATTSPRAWPSSLPTPRMPHPHRRLLSTRLAVAAPIAAADIIRHMPARHAQALVEIVDSMTFSA